MSVLKSQVENCYELDRCDLFHGTEVLISEKPISYYQELEVNQVIKWKGYVKVTFRRYDMHPFELTVEQDTSSQ